MPVVRRRYAPLNFKGRPIWYFRLRPAHIVELWAWRKADDNKLWRNLALAMVVSRQVLRLVGRAEEVLASERLQPGDRLTIIPVSQRTRAERKAAKRWRPGR